MISTILVFLLDEAAGEETELARAHVGAHPPAVVRLLCEGDGGGGGGDDDDGCGLVTNE